VGSQIHGAPTQVKIWFTEKLEPALSKIQVFNISGLEVDKRDVKIDPSNAALLTVSLPELKPGCRVCLRCSAVESKLATSSEFKRLRQRPCRDPHTDRCHIAFERAASRR
jgi:hypothetical protein